jgi:hypothetical protein
MIVGQVKDGQYLFIELVQLELLEIEHSGVKLKTVSEE